ncbi:hypothetical protein [Paraburkholderia aspalathi]|uniref:hypothetical protein n=1 Tax=Paraburkholderia aspalathi TaxID=1324617 RepID=UPI0038B88B83
MLLQPRPTSLVLFHCIFDDYGIASHGSHSFDLESYIELPDLYAVCAIDEFARPEKMVGGMMIKTNIAYGAPGFLESIATAAGALPRLQTVTNARTSFLPAPVDADSPKPLSESQALHVFKQLWSEHLASNIHSRFPRARP